MQGGASPVVRKLDAAHLRCLQTLRACGRAKLHPLAFIERAETGRLDRTEVYEHVRATAIDRDEAEALLTVEPLDSSLCHENLLASRGRTSRLSNAVER